MKPSEQSFHEREQNYYDLFSYQKHISAGGDLVSESWAVEEVSRGSSIHSHTNFILLSQDNHTWAGMSRSIIGIINLVYKGKLYLLYEDKVKIDSNELWDEANSYDIIEDFIDLVEDVTHKKGINGGWQEK